MRAKHQFTRRDQNKKRARRNLRLMEASTNSKPHSPPAVKKSVKGQKTDDLTGKMINANPKHQNKGTRPLSTAPGPSRTPQGPRLRSGPRSTLVQRRFTRSELRQGRKLNRALRIHLYRALKPCQREPRVSLARSVRSLQLRSPSLDPSPSPPSTLGHTRMCACAYRTRRYRMQLLWYQLLQHEKKKQQRMQGAQSSADSSSVKGTTECLDNIRLTYQRKKRKRSSPSAQKPPEMKKSSRKTNRRSWRRQLDSSSSDSFMSEGSTNVTPVCSRVASSGSPGTQSCQASVTLTSLQAIPSNKQDCAQAKIPAAADQSVNNNGTCTPDQALAKQCKKNRITFSGLKEQKNSNAAKQTLIGFHFPDISSNLGNATVKSPSATLKTVKFKDSPTGNSLYISSLIQISDVASKPESSVPSQNQSKRPSTPHVCKSNKKLERCPRSSPATKQKLQKCKNLNDLEANGKRQADKLDMTPKVSSSVSRTQSTKDPQQTKQSIKHVSQTTLHSPLQTETRSEASPQVLSKTPSPERSAKPPASKRTLGSFKCQSSYASLDNLKTVTPTQTPFRKPDTPRPKSCPESLKWKKVLEERTKNTRPIAACMSSCQGQSLQTNSSQPSSLPGHVKAAGFENLIEPSPEQSLKLCNDSTPICKFMQKCFHENKPDHKHGIIEEQDPAAELVARSMPSPTGIKDAVQSNRVKEQTPSTPHAHVTPEQPSSTSSPEITQAIFSAMSFFMCIQPVESEPGSINITCYPSPSSDSSPFGVKTRKSGSQRANISGHQYYAITIKPVDHIQASQSQEPSQLAQARSTWPEQGGDDNHTHHGASERTVTKLHSDAQKKKRNCESVSDTTMNKFTPQT